MPFLIVFCWSKYLINFIFTAAQSLDELAGDARKKVFDDGFSEIKARAAFKPAKLAEPAPHLTYNANDLENLEDFDEDLPEKQVLLN